MANGSPGQVWIRRDVWKLQGDWDPVLLWYAKAVAEMKKRPLDDPLSWRFQAAVHGYDRSVDPYSTPSDRYPSSADMRRYWNQCQHASWFFLPWHRVYLGLWERMVRNEIKGLNGPWQDWALPYWNYSKVDDPATRYRLPPAFTALTLPDGTKNELRLDHALRPGLSAAGDVPFTPGDVALGCLDDDDFILVPNTGATAFGGPTTGFSHGGGDVGSLEATPHGNVHVTVGFQDPVVGLMAQFETAGLDPVFWLHHANIDRLWQIWLNRPGKSGNPATTAWRDATAAVFHFFDETGQKQTFTPRPVEATETSPFHYKYEDLSDPTASISVAAGPILAPPAPSLESTTAMTADDKPAEMVGGTEGPVALSSAAPRSVDIAIVSAQPVALESLAAGQPAGGPRRVFLTLSNITARRPTTRVSVYLGERPATEAVADEGQLAGTLPMFGVTQASDPAAEHGGSGLSYVLDVTKVVERLQNKGQWDPQKLKVTFVPAGSVDADTDLKVGSVRVHYK